MRTEGCLAVKRTPNGTELEAALNWLPRDRHLGDVYDPGPGWQRGRMARMFDSPFSWDLVSSSDQGACRPASRGKFVDIPGSPSVAHAEEDSGGYLSGPTSRLL